MWFESFLRATLRKLWLGESRIVLENRPPSLEERLGGVDELGLYLHIPFCRQICPYCPYNKELYHPEAAARYVQAVKKEIDTYGRLIGHTPITSFYIGGGTPTTLLEKCLGEILEHIYRTFKMHCGIHLESHPNDLSLENLRTIRGMGVEYLSIGVEALQDRHLKTLARPYSAGEVKAAIGRAVEMDFQCVNADVIFALPHQTYGEVEEAGHTLVELGVDQVATYPLFVFPYTKLAQTLREEGGPRPDVFQRKKMLGILEDIFYAAGFQRTSVWAFTKPGISKYCSVTVPQYIGLGASGGSYLKDIFYLNTFSVGEYIGALENGRMPIALSLELSERMQVAGWLYWKIYETRFKKSEFKRSFGRDLDSVYGRYLKALALAGFLKDQGDEIVLSDAGTYWLHVLEDLFSIEYVSKLWGTSKQDPWPERVIL